MAGNSKTCLIITGSPCAGNAEETLSTLRFGTRAKSIQNRAVINEEKSVEEYKQLLREAHAKIAAQEALIKALQGVSYKRLFLVPRSGVSMHAACLLVRRTCPSCALVWLLYLLKRSKCLSQLPRLALSVSRAEPSRSSHSRLCCVVDSCSLARDRLVS